MTIQPSEVLLPRDAAHFLGLSESTLAKMRVNGSGPPYCKLGRRVVYRRPDLSDWLAVRVVRSTTDVPINVAKGPTTAHPDR